MYLPLFVSVEGKKCLIIGGGKIAYRKALTLHQYGADLHVVAEAIGVKALYDLISQEQLIIEHVEIDMDYLHQLIGGKEKYFMVIGATSDPELNQMIADYCEAHHILVNNITSPDACNVRFGARIEGEDYQVAVSSKGESPKRAVKLRDKIRELLGNKS